MFLWWCHGSLISRSLQPCVCVCAFKEVVTSSRLCGLTLVRKDFTCGWGHTGWCCEPGSSGVACQVQGYVAALGLRGGGYDVSLAQAVGAHDITTA